MHFCFTIIEYYNLLLPTDLMQPCWGLYFFSSHTNYQS